MSEPVNPTRSSLEAPASYVAAPPIAVRVNLLPGRYRQQAESRRAKGIAAACVVGAVVVTGGLWMWARSEVNSAQDQVTQAQATNQQLVAEAAQYAAVPEAYAVVDRAEAEVQLAMATDVRWSLVLNDLSLTIPQGVGLTTMDVTTNGTAPPPSPDPAAPVSVIGSVSYGGEATSYPKVSEWLDSQSKQLLYSNVYLGTASKSAESGQVTVTFSSTADITEAALSRRYDNPTAG